MGLLELLIGGGSDAGEPSVDALRVLPLGPSARLPDSLTLLGDLASRGVNPPLDSTGTGGYARSRSLQGSNKPHPSPTECFQIWWM